MKRLDNATVQRILDTAEIVDVVSDFVSLKRRGSGYIGLCPFHNERTPSFSVSPAKGICKCFSCGKGGSPVNFIMELEKMSYYDALKYLAKKYNIEIQERELTDEERRAESERESMLAINDWALKYFEHTLRDTTEGRDIGRSYFMERGISEAMMKKFHLGYAPESRDAMHREALKQGYTEQYLEATGLCAKRESDGSLYDRFRGRVIYPVFSVSGKVVAFGGRTLRSDKTVAKYVNSPESVIYSKSHELYGLYQAKNAIVNRDKVILVEGYMDVISMFQSGVENVVASSGTSLTVGQIRLLRRFSKNVTVIYDSDAAGIKASLRGIDLLLAEGLDVKVLQFPEGDDPDSYAQSHTAEELERYLSENEVDFIRFKTGILLKGVENDPIKRAAVISDICRSIAVIPELISRTVYIGETSRMLGIDEQVLALQVARNIADNAQKEKTDRQRREGQADITRLEQNEAAQAARMAQEIAATTAPQQPRIATRRDTPGYLMPFEREVLRYVLRYGMASISMLSDDGTQTVTLTVLDYVKQEMELDSMEITTPSIKRTLEAVDSLIAESWARDYNSFLASLDEDVTRWRREGTADIRNRLDAVTNVAAEEKKLEAAIEARRLAAIADFECSFISRSLISSPDDDVRTLTTDLVSEKYVLSNMHTRFGHIPSEYERLGEFVPRAVYEWKDAILDVGIKEINDRLTAECRKPDSDPQKVMELMAEKTRHLELKREFAKVLGERIVAPRNI